MILLSIQKVRLPQDGAHAPTPGAVGVDMWEGLENLGGE